MARKKADKPRVPAPFPTALQLEFQKINSQKKPRSKYMIAAEAHRGEVWVRDPMLLL